MIDRLRRNRDPLQQPHRLSRRERELRQRRLLYLAMAVVTGLVVVLLAGGAIYEFGLRPRQVLATVNGEKIRRSDYWEMRRYTLLSQIQQYRFFSAQNPQYAAYVQQLQQQLQTVKSSPVDPQTLTTMINDRVTVQRLDRLGLSISADDVTSYIAENFAPVPINTPTPSPTINPTAAAWSAQTATAAAAASPRPLGTPGTPGVATPGTPTSPTPQASPGTPAAATPTGPASATPNREEAIATATAAYAQYTKSLKDAAGMSQDDFVRLVIKPAIAKQKVTDRLVAAIPDVQPQVHAAHILLATKDGAEQARKSIVEGGKSFDTVAKDQSIDTTTAPNGGDLGWFPRGVMVSSFEDVAFALAPGEISQPVQTKFGWHIIKTIEKDDARPLTEQTLKSLQNGAYDKWLEDQKSASRITSILPVTPTPAPAQFEPPPGAPPTPTPIPPTPLPASPVPGTPVVPVPLPTTAP